MSMSNKTIPYLLPGKDYPFPRADWTQQQWNNNFRLITVKSEYGYLQMHEHKKTERRNKVCPSVPCLIKTSIGNNGKGIDIPYVTEWMEDKSGGILEAAMRCHIC